MRVKRFHGETIHEAVEKMKKEFGSDAVILHTKRVKHGGFFGLFGRQVFEVIGAIDAVEPEAAAERGFAQHGQPQAQPREPVEESTLRLDRAGQGEKPWSAWDKDGSASSSPISTNSTPSKVMWPDTIDNVYQQLIQCDLPKETAQTLLKGVLQTLPKHDWQDLAKIWNHVNTQIASGIATVEPWDFDGTQKRAVLVGPTGVGKTTTVAKLAANFALVAGKKVGLITVDTYRIAAVDQLRTYADIIGVPLRVAYSPEELRQALSDMADRDLVLIDTAGRSQRNKTQMAELKAFLDGIEAEVHLVVSATTKDRDLADIIRFFSTVNIDRLIVTKLDETTGFGALLQATTQTKAPIAFITTGQSVPEDIEIAEPQKIAEWILGD